MNPNDTHTCLPAARIADACEATLTQIRSARLKIAGDIIKEKNQATIGLADLAERHRQAEFERLTELKALADAAKAIDIGFTVQVSLGDFTLIRSMYS